MRVYVVPQGQLWQVKKETLHATGTSFQTKGEAIKAARKYGLEIQIFRANGDLERSELASVPVVVEVPVEVFPKKVKKKRR